MYIERREFLLVERVVKNDFGCGPLSSFPLYSMTKKKTSPFFFPLLCCLDNNNQ
jgi:hypothetical protein